MGDEKVGNGRYQSAWECAVCNQRWEDHETAFELQSEYTKKSEMSSKQRARSMADLRGATSVPEGLPWGDRASEVGRLLDENSYGISGKHKEADHYAIGCDYHSYKNQIQQENALLRERETELLRLQKQNCCDGI